MADEWEAAGRLALVGIGVEPGLSDVFARYAADHLFSAIDELGTRDGANLTVDGYDFAPSFSIWTTIEECLNPPVIWEDGEWFTTAPFSEPEVFDFPEGIGPVECVNVEHEEVLLMPRWVETKRATFKYGLGNEFIEVLKTLHKLGLDTHREGQRVEVGGDGRRGLAARRRGRVPARPRDPRRRGCTARPAPASGSPAPALDGQPRSTYLYHVVDNEWSMQEYGHQCVVWQTAVNPVVALELLGQRHLVAAPACSGRRPSTPCRSSSSSTAYGVPWGQQVARPADRSTGWSADWTCAGARSPSWPATVEALDAPPSHDEPLRAGRRRASRSRPARGSSRRAW